MTTTWLSTAERIVGNSAGDMEGDGSYKLLLHSTEGGSIAGAVAAYEKNNSWPTLTVDMPERRIAQHNAGTVAARALRNEAGGVQTNREGTVLIQVEIVGFAGTPSSLGSDDDWAWFGRTVFAWARDLGVPMRRANFMAYPASYGKSAVRMTAGEWDAFSGILGHQHAPENSHGDPGDVNRQVDIAIAAAGGDLFMPAQFETLDAKLDRVLASLTRIEGPQRRQILAELEEDQALAERIRTQLDTNVDGSVVDRLIESQKRTEARIRELLELLGGPDTPTGE
jgi:hypothetical protein